MSKETRQFRLQQNLCIKYLARHTLIFRCPWRSSSGPGAGAPLLHARALWSPCGRRDEVVGGVRRLLVTSRTSSWVVPPPKVIFYKEAPGVNRPERLYCSSTERAVGTSQRRVFDRVGRRIRRDRLLWSRMGAWQSRSSRSTTPSQDGRKVGGGPHTQCNIFNQAGHAVV